MTINSDHKFAHILWGHLAIFIIFSFALFLPSTTSAATQRAIPKGVEFNPEIYTAEHTPIGQSWFDWYDDPSARAQVNAEMHAIKSATNAGMITVFMQSDWQLSWPTPTPAQLSRLVNFVNDAKSHGLSVWLVIGTPCVVPNSAFPPNATYQHVGGHKAGEVVNGTTLWWDVSYCGDDNIALAKAWYGQILSALDQKTTPGALVSLTLSGLPELPFSAEMNTFLDGYSYMSYAQNYVSQLIPYLKSISSTPIGISLLPDLNSANVAYGYSFLTNFLSAVDISTIDFLDITADISINPTEIMNRVGAANSGKVILSDFKFIERKDTPLNIMNKIFADIRTYGFGGWWIWQYKPEPNESETLMLGIRQRGYFGDTGGWRDAQVSLIQSDLVPTVNLSASPSSITSGQSSTLSWSSANVISCAAAGAWGGDKPTSGSQAVSPTVNSTYTLECLAGVYSFSKTVTVSVVPDVDTTSPQVSITSPSNGSTVKGTINITASASDNVGVKSVSFKIDNNTPVTDTTAPYLLAWKTSSSKVGTHTITATARDYAGNQKSASITVKVVR